jgi:hypothetical protein
MHLPRRGQVRIGNDVGDLRELFVRDAPDALFHKLPAGFQTISHGPCDLSSACIGKFRLSQPGPCCQPARFVGESGYKILSKTYMPLRRIRR